MSYAGFWKRFAAAIIDMIITMVGGFAIGFVFGIVMVAGGTSDPAVLEGIGNILGLILGWIYFAAMESSLHKAPLGKWRWESKSLIWREARLVLVRRLAVISARSFRL